MSHAAAVVVVAADVAVTRAVIRLPSGRLGRKWRTELSRDVVRRGVQAVDEMPAGRVIPTVAAVGGRRFRGSAVVATRMTRGSSSLAWMKRPRLLIGGLPLTTNCCPKVVSIVCGTCRVGWKPSASSSPATWTVANSRPAVEFTAASGCLVRRRSLLQMLCMAGVNGFTSAPGTCFRRGGSASGLPVFRAAVRRLAMRLGLVATDRNRSVPQKSASKLTAKTE